MKVKRRNDPDVRAFWSRHVALWMRSAFSQREYCERHGISRSLMSKWWIWLREDRAREERIKISRCRGRSRRSTMTNEASHRTYDAANVSPAALLKEKADRPVVRRRRFTEDEKRHFLDLANKSGSSISDVAQRHDLALSLLFRWRKELGEGAAPFAGFSPVSVVDGQMQVGPVLDDVFDPISAIRPTAPLTGGMEIALKDGRRVRVDADTDPEAVRRLLTLLEGTSP